MKKKVLGLNPPCARAFCLHVLLVSPPTVQTHAVSGVNGWFLSACGCECERKEIVSRQAQWAVLPQVRCIKHEKGWITVNYHKTFVALICRLLIHETSCLQSTFCLIWALGSVETQNLLMPVVICTQARFNASFPRILRHADWVGLGFNRWPGRPPERWKKIPNNSSHRDLSNTFQSFKHGLLYRTPSELQRCK